jgi:hypothetical protein
MPTEGRDTPGVDLENPCFTALRHSEKQLSHFSPLRRICRRFPTSWHLDARDPAKSLEHREARKLLCRAPMRSLLLAVLLLGCSPSDPAKSDSGIHVDPDGSETACGTGMLCLVPHRVVLGATIPNGRLGVVFYQLVDDYNPYPDPVVALDIPFDASAPAINIPLSLITLPSPRSRYDFCLRTCYDEANPACVCQAGKPQVATAFVVVTVDANSSGHIEPAEIVNANLYGIGVMHFGASDTAFPASNELQQLFPEGILQGLVPYRIIDNATGFDQLGLPPSPAIYDLDLCVPGDASCDDLRVPNLT